MKALFRFVLFLFAAAGLMTACNKEDNHIEYVNGQIYEMMKDYYYWYNFLPTRVDPGSYSTPNEFMEALRYPVYDRWSYVMTTEEYTQYFEEGEMIGHGISYGMDQGGNIRICFVYRNTEAIDKGVKRGWIMLKINGTNVTPSNISDLFGDSKVGVKNNITFINENGATVELSLTKEELSLTPVLHYEVLNQGDLKIGYMVFQDFIRTANEELDEVFNSFVTAGVDDVIIDLRYNGGGFVDVAEHMAGWLIGRDFGGENFLYYEHNDKLSVLDTVYTVPVKPNGLSLGRVFFIGTEYTASASELIIKGVEPFVPSILAGDTTHGKPVGMYRIPISDYMTFPVCFKYSNKKHEGDFYNGLPPEIAADDDMTKDFGDPEEASLKAILDYIQSGNTPAKSTRSAGYHNRLIEPKGPLGEFLKAY